MHLRVIALPSIHEALSSIPSATKKNFNRYINLILSSKAYSLLEGQVSECEQVHESPKNGFLGQAQWFTPVIPANWEVEIGKFVF
jgi:hypothetical protein